VDETTARAAQAHERAGELLTKFKRRNETMLVAQTKAAAVTATATSADGSIRVTVDAGGMLTHLDISPAAQGDVARTIVEVVRRATAQARAGVREIYEPLRHEGVLRDPPFLLPDPQPARPPRRTPEPWEDEQQGRVLRDDAW
jgi:DNA-binding protein YbaB